MYRTLAEVVEGIERGIRDSQRPEDRTLAKEYLAVLAPLLAAAVLGKDILGELPKVERLLGQTWLIDDSPFREALSKWRLFREEYERFALSGMTVNERLFALGTLEAFDAARTAGNAAEVRRLLEQAYVDEPSIGRVIEEL
jgi:hypothetical protein